MALLFLLMKQLISALPLQTEAELKCVEDSGLITDDKQYKLMLSGQAWHREPGTKRQVKSLPEAD